MIFRDRLHAGRVLADKLRSYAGRDDVIVLALPRGGVPVAFEVAQALNAPMDVFLVRKLGLPGQEEYAMGAIASGGVRVINRDAVDQLDINPGTIDQVAAREQAELDRRQTAYRGNRPDIQVTGKIAVVVDDGLATGSTMRAAVAALRSRRPARIVVAVPVAAESTCRLLRVEADEVVCAATPNPFYGVGQWYDNFDQTTDDDVRQLLARAEPSMQPKRHVQKADESRHVAAIVQRCAQAITGASSDYDALLARIDDAPLVLIGEASHGTHEFYRIRADITRRLIVEKGFNIVAIEADWPDAYRVNRYVNAVGDDATAALALSAFERFPAWMWRNEDVLDFVTWLRDFNDDANDTAAKTSLYGLDLYSLHSSIEAVLAYLQHRDPEAAQRAQRRYACFDHFGDNILQTYGYAAGLGLSKSCEDEVVAQLSELSCAAAHIDGHIDDELFFAEQNARLVRNAEAYYRSMFQSHEQSWNLRDRHMMETLQTLIRLRKRAAPNKIVVWAHNSHLGDARATAMSARGELNLGQLVREHYDKAAVLVGFSTYQGQVTAASDWNEPTKRMRVQPGLPGSYEALFHSTNIPRFQLRLDEENLAQVLGIQRLQRAIGVVYRPQTERQSHYFESRLSEQFDWLLHIDDTTAVRPLSPGEHWLGSPDEPPETYPSGL